MLLTELTGVKRFHKQDQFQLEKLLRRMGITVIGAGKYGQVFSHPSWSYVVKVFGSDPHYLSFVNFVLQHPNPHFPKIIKRPLQMHKFWKRDSRQSQKLWLVRIEKLAPLNKTVGEFLAKNLERGVTYLWSPESEYREFEYLQPDGSWKKMMFGQLLKLYPWFKSLCEAWNVLMQNPQLEGSLDYNPDNFMQRKDGTIVIIDPLWEGGLTPYQAYDAWMKSESGWDDYDEYDTRDYKITGPNYLKKNQKPKPEPAQQFVRALTNEPDDDIPF